MPRDRSQRPDGSCARERTEPRVARSSKGAGTVRGRPGTRGAYGQPSHVCPRQDAHEVSSVQGQRRVSAYTRAVTPAAPPGVRDTGVMPDVAHWCWRVSITERIVSSSGAVLSKTTPGSVMCTRRCACPLRRRRAAVWFAGGRATARTGDSRSRVLAAGRGWVAYPWTGKTQPAV